MVLMMIATAQMMKTLFQSQTNCGLGICRGFGVNRCVNGSVEDSCVPEPNSVQEGGEFLLRCDGFDNDCDGRTDEGYPDFEAANRVNFIVIELRLVSRFAMATSTLDRSNYPL